MTKIANLAIAVVVVGFVWVLENGVGPFLDLVDSSPTTAWLFCGWLAALIIAIKIEIPRRKSKDEK